ncbi:hypothetical protein QFC20_006371 [Naganishia adeliensis]|uniref:Uncharacterized protein n=1 Tax=Naganishia adeliensis TaxID=92952 RepID=A0ACC2VBA9_9TREE|nr:hypothetical protein QFC20_006371 [Naganishia adeliensis]
MGKKKSKKQVFVIKPWCWYCEREFEDEKVLLQHQKAKHFKCNHCPRKLNTAGGLMVHCQQVHKTEPDKLENTLPGRDGYDIEIFGMEGVPTKAQAEWRARKEAEAGVAGRANAATSQGAKRPRIYKGVISEVDLAGLLAQHKALMSGQMKSFVPPGMPPMMGMPPPTFAGGMPMGMPPFMPPNGMPQMPPFAPPPGFMPPPPGAFPPFAGSPAAMPSAVGTPPFLPPIAGLPARPPFLPPNPALAGGAAVAAPPPPAPVSAPITATVMPPKDGVMWPDAEASPAEKRALQPKYKYTSPTPSNKQPVPVPSNGLPPTQPSQSGISAASGAGPSNDGSPAPETGGAGLSSRKRKAAADFLD